MNVKFLTNIDLSKNQIIKAIIQKVSTDPDEELVAGWIIYNTTENKIKYYNGTEWVDTSSGGGGGGGSDVSIVRKSNPLIQENDGVCNWTISDITFSSLPCVNIYETSTGNMILADVNVDVANSEIVITFKNMTDDIAAGTYTVVIIV